MSLHRLSLMNDTLYVPEPDGTLAKGAGGGAVYRGRLGCWNETASGPGDGEKALLAHWAQVLPAGALPADQPLTVLVHGWLFDPSKTRNNPHHNIYQFTSEKCLRTEHLLHHTPWPLRLGYTEGLGMETGAVVGFGWLSEDPSGLLLGKNYQDTWPLALKAAEVLASVLRTLAQQAGPDRPIHLFCHSFGTVVVVKALLRLIEQDPAWVANRVGKVFLLGGAASSEDAESLVRQSPPWPQPGPEFFNVTCDKDWPVNHIARPFRPAGTSPMLIGVDGISGDPALARWIDLRFDRKDVQQWFAALGYSVESNPPGPGFNHHYYFTLPANTNVYRDLLRKQGPLDGGLGGLLAAGVPRPGADARR